MTANHLADLRTIIERLDSCGRLTRVTTEVDPKFDLAGIAAHFESKPRAVLFEKVKGYDVPVFTGLYWSRELLAQLMAQEEATLPGFVSGCIQNWQKKPVPPVMVDHGPILDAGPHPLDLSTLPIPIHAIKDGGPYFDAAVVIARDPETGVRNASIQRFMVVDKDTLHINIDAGRHLGLYLEKAKQRNESLTFSLNCGVGPGPHFAAATPAEAAPPDTDELGIASEFHGAPLELVHGRTLPVHIVANAMYALECEMIPGELGDEGPFAEVTGYYASREPRPVVHVRAIHARPDPVFQTILSGSEVWNSVGLLGEAFSAFPPLKMVTVVDEDVDIRNSSDVEWAMATRLNASTGIVTIENSFGHGLNPTFPDYLGTKVGFDCCRPYPHTTEFDRANYKPVDIGNYSIQIPEIEQPQEKSLPLKERIAADIRMTVAHATQPSLKERIQHDVSASHRHSGGPSLKDRIRLDVRHTQHHAGIQASQEQTRLTEAANDQARPKARIGLVRG